MSFKSLFGTTHSRILNKLHFENTALDVFPRTRFEHTRREYSLFLHSLLSLLSINPTRHLADILPEISQIVFTLLAKHTRFFISTVINCV